MIFSYILRCLQHFNRYSSGEITGIFESKNEREFIPYDTAKIHFEKLISQMSTQQTTYFTTIRNLEEKYKKIELEANGHFSAFVTQIKSQYAVKFDTFR